MFRASMDLGLKGKIAMVTASSKGIGYGMAKVLASEGCRVVISSRSIDSISRARDQIVEETGNREVYAFSADLTVKGDVDRLVKNANEKLGSVDILAYNTGPPKPGTFNELSEPDWDYGVKMLLMNAVWLAKRLLPAMECGAKGITSNGIMQGHILTDRQREIAEDISRRTGKSIDDAMKQALAEVPLGRYGTPEEVGCLVAFLASDKARYVNGAMIPLDGGMIKSVF